MLIITGLSGAGKSIVLKALEDNGYYCVDNLPVMLLEKFIREFASHCAQPVAVAIDSRNPESISQLPAKILALRQEFSLSVMFLTTDSNVIARRFNETRRPHPMQLHDKTKVQILSSIEKERELLSDLASLADITLDTTPFRSNELREKVMHLVSQNIHSLQISLQSFGYKNGLPVNADFIFDVRFLPNPYWDEKLKPYTGLDQPIIDFLQKQSTTQDFINSTSAFLEKWIPQFTQNTNRAYLTICFGCTGGQHRSVFMTENIGKLLQKKFPEIIIEHRDLPRIKK